MNNQASDVSEEQLEYIRCVQNIHRGLLISNPAQCICEYCGNTWVYETPAPICPVLKAVHDKSIQQFADGLVEKQELVIEHGAVFNEMKQYWAVPVSTIQAAAKAVQEGA